MNEDSNIKEGISATFDEVATSYDNNLQFEISASKLLIFINEQNLLSTSNILDLSTGTGAIVLKLAKKFPKAFVTALDISQNMLDIAKGKAQRENICNIEFIKEDVETSGFRNKKFNLITCGYGIFFYPNIQKTYLNICNHIKENGQFIFTTFTNEAFEPYVGIFKEILQKEFDISYPKQLDENSLQSKEEIQNLTKLSNHKSMQIQDIEIIYTLSIEQWWDLLNTSGYKGLIMQLDDKQIVSLKKEYFKVLETYAKNNILTINANSYFTVLNF
jgi:ubiquinone/menaquinone biosynthesis C-methylase UbiE